MQTRWDQGLALDEYRKKWAMQRKKTRRYCHRCGCVLYVRSATDTVADEKDLDEVYFSPHGQIVACFRCHTSPSSLFLPFRYLIDETINLSFY